MSVFAPSSTTFDHTLTKSPVPVKSVAEPDQVATAGPVLWTQQHSLDGWWWCTSSLSSEMSGTSAGRVQQIAVMHRTGIDSQMGGATYSLPT
jgi:hypothetical protein